MIQELFEQTLRLQIQFRVLDHLTLLVMLGVQERIEGRRRTANRFNHLLEKDLAQSCVLHSLGDFTIDPLDHRGRGADCDDNTNLCTGVKHRVASLFHRRNIWQDW